MINFKLRMYFDRAAVIKMLDPVTRKALIESGRAIRADELKHIKERKVGDYSKPGNPPHAHMRARVRKWNKQRQQRGEAPISTRQLRGIRMIEYVFDPASRSVVAGPIGFGKSGTPVPNILEFGGDVKAGSKKKPVRATIAPRPYAGPALAREIPFMAERFRGNVSRGGF